MLYSIQIQQTGVLRKTSNPLILNLLTFLKMVRICRGLALLGTTTSDATIAAALGRDAGLVRAVGIGARLGLPVAFDTN